MISVFRMRNGGSKKGGVPQLWDGKASERIVNILLGRPDEPFQPQTPMPKAESSKLLTLLT